MSITELAPAKLNLTLDVGARRPDRHRPAHRAGQPGLEGGGRLFPGDKYPPYRDFHPIGEENPLPGRSWRRQQ